MFNSRVLREKLKWQGIMFDDMHRFDLLGHFNETITSKNVQKIFEKYSIPFEFGVLSESMHYADYWILEAILKKYKPKLVVHEVNQQGPEACVAIKKSKEFLPWDGSDYHGGSTCAFYCLAKQLDYTMVYCESTGTNCFWVRNDLVDKNLRLSYSLVQAVLTPDFLYQRPEHMRSQSNMSWEVIIC